MVAGRFVYCQSLLLLLITTFSIYPSQKPCADAVSIIPSTSSQIEAFIPAGWEIFQQVEGPLFADSCRGVVLSIKLKSGNQQDDDTDNDLLLIILKAVKGGYEKYMASCSALPCSGCGGVLGGGADIKIAKNVIVISAFSGSREATSNINRYRFDGTYNKFVLIGEDEKNWDRLTGEGDSTSTNYLTGMQIVNGKKSKIGKTGPRFME
jgi:hypothetical protein